MMEDGEYGYPLEATGKEILSSVTSTNPPIINLSSIVTWIVNIEPTVQVILIPFPTICLAPMNIMIAVLGLKEIVTQQLLKRGYDP